MILGISACLGLLACGIEATTHLGKDGNPIPPLPKPPTFDGGREPVVVSVGGRLITAAVSTRENWPVLILDDGSELRFPGEGAWRDGLAMVAGPDGMLHAVWAADRSMVYARIDPVTRRGVSTIVGETQVGHGALAIAPDGQVAIAYADGHISRAPTENLTFVEGSFERGFSDPIHINPGCCDSWADPDGAYDIGIPSLAFDGDGDLWVVSGWSVNFPGTVDILRRREGVWQVMQRLEGGYEGIAPKIAAGENYLHVVQAIEGGTKVRHLSNPRSFYEIETIELSAPARALQLGFDGDGNMHLGVALWSDDVAQLEHYRGDELGRLERSMLAEAESSRRALVINPSSGGMAIDPDGTVHFGIQRSERPSYGQTGTIEVVSAEPPGK